MPGRTMTCAVQGRAHDVPDCALRRLEASTSASDDDLYHLAPPDETAEWMPLSITIDSSSPVKDTVWDTVYSPLGVRKMMASVVDDGEPPVHASEQVATNSSPICTICSIPVPAAQLPEHLWEHQPIIFLTPRGEHTVSQTVSFTGEDESTLML